MRSEGDDPCERYQALAAKVDAHFETIYARHGDAMQCGSGCADCCHARLSVTLVEAADIARGLARLPAETRAVLTAQAERGNPDRCAALGADDRCLIYPWRPLVCRSHGAPIRRPPRASEPDSRPRSTTRASEPDSRPRSTTRASEPEHRGSRADRGPTGARRRTLPVLDVCPRNFDGGAGLAEVEPAMTFDQDTLSTVLGVIDAAFADTCGVARGIRFDLADLVGHPERHFDLDDST